MPSTAKHKITILTEIIAPYRIPVFNALSRNENVALHVIFLAETDASLRQWRVYKDEIQFSYEVLRSRRWRIGKRNMLLNAGMRKALSAASPDSVICGGYNYLASWEALAWARRKSIPFFLWSESNRQDARSGRTTVEFLKREFLKRCAGFVVPGKSAHTYLESLGVSADRIITAPNAVDNEVFARQAKAVKQNENIFSRKLALPARYILYAGRLVREKGVFDLLDAYSRLAADLRSVVSLVYVGDGAAREELQTRAKEISPGEVLYSGFIHRDEIASFYSFADVLVLPTHSDTWGLVVNEGMACGLPIIVSNVAGCVSDLVDDGWNGYSVLPKNPKRLAEVLESLLKDTEKILSMGEHSRQRIQHYSPEACAQGLAQVAAFCATEVQ